MELWNEAVGIFHQGVDHIKPIQGVIIGLLFGLSVSSVGGLFILPAIAAIVYIAVDVIFPALFDHKDLVMPHFDAALGHQFLTLYIVFFVVSAVLFLIKTVLASFRS